MLRYTSDAVLHGSNLREALEAASAILVAEGYSPITVVSGDREYDEQVEIFLARYVPVGQVSGRRVYDFRWWEGRQWARISPAGTVAAPSRQAPHVARIAADLGWPYNDSSSAAHRRLQQIAPGLGLDWTGRFFGEDWHWETTRGVGRIDFGQVAGNESEEDDMNQDQNDALARVDAFVKNFEEHLGPNFAKDLAAVRLFDGIPGVNLSVGRLRQALDASPQLLDRFIVSKGDANGKGAYDLAQLTQNEIRPMLQALVAAIGRPRAASSDSVDVKALAAALREALGDADAAKLASVLAP